MILYKDKNYSPEERTEDLLNRMTLEEKVGQLMQVNGQVNGEDKIWAKDRCAGSFLHVFDERLDEIQKMAEETRLGIPIIFGIDAIHGNALHNGSTIFPTQLALSSSWDVDLLENVAHITAKEVSLTGPHWTFSPVLCIGRDVRWGRINETFGEDPYLIGELACAMIKGYQGKNLNDRYSILACAKHYVAYGESIGARDSVESEVSERKLRSLFLPPFKKAVDVGCATFMAGYNSVDGIPCSSNKKLLKDILRDEWGFEGFVVTDWNNVGSLIENQHVANSIEDASIMSIEAGNDLIMNTNDFYDKTIELVKNGKLSEKLIDESVRKILLMKFKLGLFDEKRYRNTDNSENILCNEEHQQLAKDSALKSMVLLKNKGDLLPLSKSLKKIAVIGPNADDIVSQLGDWTLFGGGQFETTSAREELKVPIVSVLDGICKYGEKYNIEVVYEKGCDVLNTSYENISGAVDLANESDVVIAVVGDNNSLNGEQKDRCHVDLTGKQEELLRNLKATGKPLIVVLINGKPLSIPWVKENADSILEAWNPGLFGGDAVASILFGDYNPEGKLSISFPYHVGQQPTYYNQFSGWHGGKYADTGYNTTPLFAFGYGLSFNKYEYSDIKVKKIVQDSTKTESCLDFNIDDIMVISVEVTNKGTFEGCEIVQLYINDLVSSVATPLKELKRFKRVYLKPSETKVVDIELKISDLTMVNKNCETVVEVGEFEIMIGSSSRDEDLKKTVITVK